MLSQHCNFLILLIQNKLPRLKSLTPRQYLYIVMGFLALTFNFVLFTQALHYISPTTVQVLWQLAPFGMILSGVWIFGERFDLYQKIGMCLLIMGLIGFFNEQFGEILQFGNKTLGILLGALAALIWVIYGTVQKLLLHVCSSAQILLLIYGGCTLLLLPMINLNQLIQLQGFELICFIYCCINTLIGYGAYGEALKHWQAAKVSIITTMLPVFTILFTWLGHTIAPHTFAALDMNITSYIGAFIVISGAILAVAGETLLKNQV